MTMKLHAYCKILHNGSLERMKKVIFSKMIAFDRRDQKKTFLIETLRIKLVKTLLSKHVQDEMKKKSM